MRSSGLPLRAGRVPRSGPARRLPFDLRGRTDRGEFAVEDLEREPEAVPLVGPKDVYPGVHFTLFVRIRSRATMVELVNVMENITAGEPRRTVRWGLWEVTQHAAQRVGGAPLHVRVQAGTVVRLEGPPPYAALEHLENRTPDGRVLAVFPVGT